jgi:hypothetical protein
VTLVRTRIAWGGTALTLGTHYDIARDVRILVNTVLEEAIDRLAFCDVFRECP